LKGGERSGLIARTMNRRKKINTKRKEPPLDALRKKGFAAAPSRGVTRGGGKNEGFFLKNCPLEGELTFTKVPN